jgi:hypothetical protein
VLGRPLGVSSKAAVLRSVALARALAATAFLVAVALRLGLAAFFAGFLAAFFFGLPGDFLVVDFFVAVDDFVARVAGVLAGARPVCAFGRPAGFATAVA